MQTYGKRGPQQQFRQLCYNYIYSSYFFPVYLYTVEIHLITLYQKYIHTFKMMKLKPCLYMVCIHYYVACMHPTAALYRSYSTRWKLCLHIYMRWLSLSAGGTWKLILLIRQHYHTCTNHFLMLNISHDIIVAEHNLGQGGPWPNFFICVITKIPLNLNTNFKLVHPIYFNLL